MDPTILRELRELIKKIAITLSPNTLFIRDVLEAQRARTLQLQLSEAMQLIRELQDSLYKVEYAENWRLVRMLVAMCYCVLDDAHTARVWAKDATRTLDAANNELNLAFAYWFLAVTYAEEGYFKDAREQYVNAKNTFHKIMSNALDATVDYQLKKECAKRISQIHQRMISISQQRTRLADSARKDQIVSTERQDNKVIEEQTTERNAGGNVLTAPINVNIHVPIDNRSADHIDQRPRQYSNVQQNPSITQEHESILATSIPLGIDFMNPAKQPEFSSTSYPDGKKPADVDNEAPIPVEIPGLAYLLTPGLPIYGKASAGPDGHVTFDEPDYDGTVDESPTVRLEGEEYVLRSLKSGDNEIRISYDDFYKSLTSLNEANEFTGRQFGWLKVSGNSMNDSNPIPIENEDYVLFSVNRNPRVDQIVIACLPGPDLQNLPLVVKRLKMKNGKLVLRSESCEKDVSYSDIEIIHEQLMGDVLAIAKPK